MAAELLEAPATAILAAAHWLLDGPLLAPFDAAEKIWRAVLPEQATGFVDAFVQQNASVHASRLALMNPYDVATIITGYITLILLGLLIKPRKFEIKGFVLLHNVFLAGLSLYMMTEVLHQGTRPSPLGPALLTAWAPCAEPNARLGRWAGHDVRTHSVRGRLPAVGQPVGRDPAWLAGTSPAGEICPCRGAADRSLAARDLAASTMNAWTDGQDHLGLLRLQDCRVQ